MVTFVCENCDQTLKKKQVDRHLYQCRRSPRLICIDCNKIFVEHEYKSHNSCISEQQKTMGQYYKPKKISNQTIKNNNLQSIQPNEMEINGTKNEKWYGWKKTIRKTLQKEKQNEMKISKLKKIIVERFLRNNQSENKGDIEEVFNEKIKNFRFQINGVNIKYIPKNERQQ